MGGEGRLRIGDRDAHEPRARSRARSIASASSPRSGSARVRSSARCSASRSARRTSRTKATSASSSAPSSSCSRSQNVVHPGARLVAGPHDRSRRPRCGRRRGVPMVKTLVIDPRARRRRRDGARRPDPSRPAVGEIEAGTPSSSWSTRRRRRRRSSRHVRPRGTPTVAGRSSSCAATTTSWVAVVPARRSSRRPASSTTSPRATSPCSRRPSGRTALRVVRARGRRAPRARHDPRARAIARASTRAGEWVDYGTRNVDGHARSRDHYYRFDADFSYRLWSYPLEEIRVGYKRLLGDTQAQMCPSTTPCTEQAGFKVGGWFELGLAPIEGIRFDARAIVIAAQDGFDPGGAARGAARHARGQPRRASAASTSRRSARTATSGSAGATVPQRCRWRRRSRSRTCRRRIAIPACGSTTTSRATSAAGVRLGIRVGYAARTQQVAGFTGGAGATVEF